MTKISVIMQDGTSQDVYESSIGTYYRSPNGDWYWYKNGQVFPLIEKDHPILDREYMKIETF